MTKANESFITGFFKLESAGGIVLILTAALAMLLANTPLASYYTLLLETPVEIKIGALEIAKPLLLWVNDGLMAVFFFLVEEVAKLPNQPYLILKLEKNGVDAIIRLLINMLASTL